MNTLSKKHKKLKDYYGLILEGAHDLKTNTCRCNREAPSEIKAILREIDHEIVNKFYGCGSPIPSLLNGCTVLDLGCGTGRDVYIASKLVGENGYVIGVDMTDEQLEVGKSHAESMAKKFGYRSPNVDFRKGYIEDLNTLGIENESIDVVISNCAINLSPTKSEVFKEIFRVLKQGGELYFSDIFAGRKVPEHLSDDPVLHGECLGGAMYLEDFRRILNKLGCPDYRTVTKSRIDLGNPEIEKKIGMVDFYSMTVRAFKLDDLEDACEDYGQIAVYKGTITGHPHYFNFDDHHRFNSNKPMLVCGNTASMLQHTRLREHFAVHGNRAIHYGVFDCAPAVNKLETPDGRRSGGVCC